MLCYSVMYSIWGIVVFYLDSFVGPYAEVVAIYSWICGPLKKTLHKPYDVVLFVNSIYIQRLVLSTLFVSTLLAAELFAVLYMYLSFY